MARSTNNFQAWWLDAWQRGRRKPSPQKMQKKTKKLVDLTAKTFYLSLAMIEEIEIVIYCGSEVELVEVVNTPVGNRALIRFEDGREDEVPLGTLEFV